jgi:PST family polysaccharide transporter
VATRTVGLLGTLLLARYLAPGEYGAAMAASIAAATANSATTFGVGIYLVSNAKVSRAETFHASCWYLTTGAVALMATLILGGPLGRWVGAPGLVKFLPVLILSALLERTLYVPERILIRNLRFGWLSLARAAGELTFTALAVTFAAHGAGAMAIAWGSFARSAVRFVAIVSAVDVREWLEPHRLRIATFRGIAGYALNVSVASIATFAMRRWDNLLIGRFFGAGTMGAYTYAYNLADTPATAIGEQLSDVVDASFPHVDQRERTQALLRSCTTVSLIMFPLSIGLAAVAPTVVETFFDPRWSNVGGMLTCLAALSAARPLANLFSSYFYASRRPGVVLALDWGSLVALVAAITTLGRVGIYWSCVSVGIVFVLRTLAAMWIASRQDDVRMSAFLVPLWRPLLVCIGMAVGVSGARLAFANLSAATLLLTEIAVGAGIYLGGMLLFVRSSCDDLLRALRSSLRYRPRDRRGPEAPGNAFPNVLSLSTEFPNPAEPGKGLFVRSRLEAIRSRTHLFVVAPVAALDYANPQRNLLASLGIPRERQEGDLKVLHPRWLYPVYGGWVNPLFLFARLLPLVARPRSRHPSFDVIDAHFAHPEGIAAVLLGRVLRRPVIVTVRGSELRYYQQRSKRFWMSWALRRADRVIAVSEGLRNLAIDLGADPRRVKTVPNGINADVFFRRDRVRCRSRHCIADAERVILSAGDLAELKGHHRVIAAVKALNERGVHAKLLIAGGIGRSGRYAGTLRQEVTALGLEEQVTFLGEVGQNVLAELMSAADVFCLASSTEGWPNVVNEALACGTAVVATDVGAVRQMVGSSRYGFVVPVDDGEALAAALHKALTGRWDHDVIAARGNSRSWGEVAEEVLEEMRAVVAERSATQAGTAASRTDRTPSRALAALPSACAGTERS